MKLYAKITNNAGKSVGKGGSEYLDIDIMVGNNRIVAFTVRENEQGNIAVFDEYDNEVAIRKTTGKNQKG
jgi:hypothetical protein